MIIDNIDKVKVLGALFIPNIIRRLVFSDNQVTRFLVSKGAQTFVLNLKRSLDVFFLVFSTFQNLLNILWKEKILVQFF